MLFKVYGITLSYNFRASLTAYYSIGFYSSGNIALAAYIAPATYIAYSYVTSFTESISMLATTKVQFPTSYISEIYCCEKCSV